MRSCIVAGLLVAASLPAHAAEVTVGVQEAHGGYRVHGTFTAAVPVGAAWGVLADYEHIGEFVTSVRTSQLVKGADGSRVLQQDAVVGSFPFRRTIRVQLSLHEEPGHRIQFRDVLGRDFQQYAGTWTLDAIPAGTRVTYDLVANPRRNFPGFVGRGAVARGSRNLLTQVRAEMLHRTTVARAVAEGDRLGPSSAR